MIEDHAEREAIMAESREDAGDELTAAGLTAADAADVKVHLRDTRGTGCCQCCGAAGVLSSTPSGLHLCRSCRTAFDAMDDGPLDAMLERARNTARALLV